MQTKVQKWGNSLGLRIPKSFAEQAGVEAGSEVDLSVEDGELIVRQTGSAVLDADFDLSVFLTELDFRVPAIPDRVFYDVRQRTPYRQWTRADHRFGGALDFHIMAEFRHIGTDLSHGLGQIDRTARLGANDFNRLPVVKPATERLHIMIDSRGNAGQCDGTFSFYFEQSIMSSEGLLAGSTLCAQYFFRDSAATGGIGHTDAIEFLIE